MSRDANLRLDVMLVTDAPRRLTHFAIGQANSRRSAPPSPERTRNASRLSCPCQVHRWLRRSSRCATEERKLTLMTAAEISVTAFTLANSLRVFAYFPQIARIVGDTDGARAVSATTWLMFLASHLTTVAYAVLSLGDWTMALIFGANAACCAAILGLTTSKRAAGRFLRRVS